MQKASVRHLFSKEAQRHWLTSSALTTKLSLHEKAEAE
jgi:hypothetical protein